MRIIFSDIPGGVRQWATLLHTLRGADKDWLNTYKIELIMDNGGYNIAGLDIPDEHLTFFVLKYGIKLPVVQE